MHFKQMFYWVGVSAVVLVLMSCAAGSKSKSSSSDAEVEQRDGGVTTTAPEILPATQQSVGGDSTRGATGFSIRYPQVDYNRNNLGNEYTPIDLLFKDKEYALKGIDTTRTNKDFYFIKERNVKVDNSDYILQFATLADFDSAQRKLNYLNNVTGLSLRLVFNAPFYKIRGGIFKTRDEAEEKVMELKLLEITAFIMKK